MTAPPSKTAADLYRELQELSEAFDRLYAEGKLSMSRDATNSQWADIDSAAAAVKASLDVAIQVTAWMDTSTALEL